MHGNQQHVSAMHARTPVGPRGYYIGIFEGLIMHYEQEEAVRIIAKGKAVLICRDCLDRQIAEASVLRNKHDDGSAFYQLASWILNKDVNEWLKLNDHLLRHL